MPAFAVATPGKAQREVCVIGYLAPSMSIRIREFVESDRETLRSIYYQARKNSFSWVNPESLKLSSFDGDVAGELIFVALTGNKPVGFISLWLPDNFIHHLFIDDRFQGQGIGRELLKVAMTRLQYPVTLKCVKLNEGAVRFYTSNGWIARSEGISQDGEYILFELTK